MDGRISSVAQLRARFMGLAGTDAVDDALVEAGGVTVVDGVLRHAHAEVWRLAGGPAEWGWQLPDDDAAAVPAPEQLHGHVLALALGAAAGQEWSSGDPDRLHAILANAAVSRAAVPEWAGFVVPEEEGA